MVGGIISNGMRVCDENWHAISEWIGTNTILGNKSMFPLLQQILRKRAPQKGQEFLKVHSVIFNFGMPNN
jgi:hypothetical protein